MRRFALSSALCAACICAGARDLEFHAELYNFSSWRSRESLTEYRGLYSTFPTKPDFNRLGRDMNDVSSWNLAHSVARVGTDCSTTLPGAVSVRAVAGLEFAYSEGAAALNMNEAYLSIAKTVGKTDLSLLAGQTWHPMAKDKPDVLSVYGEAPFNPYNLSPMAGVSARRGIFFLDLYAIGQGAFTSIGPNGRSAEYARYGLPEVLVQAGLDGGHFAAKAGADYCGIKPSVRTTYMNVPVFTSSTTDFHSYYAFFEYRKRSFRFQAKGLFTSGGEHLGTVGGYALHSSYEGIYNVYTPYRTLTCWADVSWGKELRFGLFFGGIRNLGTADTVVNCSLENTWYTEDASGILDAMRIVPSVRYTLERFTVGFEFEGTSVSYGSGELTRNGLMNTSVKRVPLNKASLMVSCKF